MGEVAKERAIADAYAQRRERGDADKPAFDHAVNEFKMRYPDVPQDVAADLVRFLIAENAELPT